MSQDESGGKEPVAKRLKSAHKLPEEYFQPYTPKCHVVSEHKNRYEFAKFFCPVKEDKSNYICNFCGEILKWKKGSQSTLPRHLWRKHSSEYQIMVDDGYRDIKSGSPSNKNNAENLSAMNDMHQPTIDTFGRTLIKRTDHGKILLRAFCDWIAADSLPLSTGQSPAFRQFMECALTLATGTGKGSNCTGMLKALHRQNIVTSIKESEDAIRKQLLKVVAKNTLSLTIDHWTSRAGQNYTGLTAHWIDGNWNLQKFDLGCFLHEGGHDGASLVHDFDQKLVQRCGLQPQQVFCVTSDTTGCMNLFGKSLESEKNILHLYCSDHNLQLTVKKVYDWTSFCLEPDEMENIEGLVDTTVNVEIVSTTLERARKLVNHFSHSTQASDSLKQVQKDNQIDYPGRNELVLVNFFTQLL